MEDTQKVQDEKAKAAKIVKQKAAEQNLMVLTGELKNLTAKMNAAWDAVIENNTEIMKRVTEVRAAEKVLEEYEPKTSASEVGFTDWQRFAETNLKTPIQGFLKTIQTNLEKEGIEAGHEGIMKGFVAMFSTANEYNSVESCKLHVRRLLSPTIYEFHPELAAAKDSRETNELNKAIKQLPIAPTADEMLTVASDDEKELFKEAKAAHAVEIMIDANGVERIIGWDPKYQSIKDKMFHKIENRNKELEKEQDAEKAKKRKVGNSKVKAAIVADMPNIDKEELNEVVNLKKTYDF